MIWPTRINPELIEEFLELKLKMEKESGLV